LDSKSDPTPRVYAGKHNPMTVDDSDPMTDLCFFIHRNKMLQHLKIESCGLHQVQMMQVLKEIKQNHTIMAVHLCNNPGLLFTEVLAQVKILF